MPERIDLASDDVRFTARLEGDRVTIDADPPLVVKDEGDGRFTVAGPDGAVAVAAVSAGASIWVGFDGHVLEFRVEADGGRPVETSPDRDGVLHRSTSVRLFPPMPATVVRIQVHPGDRVEAGATLLVLEAMKMELPIRAPREAIVRAVHCEEGQLVQPDTLLAELD